MPLLESITDAIGRTPLVKLANIVGHMEATVAVKLEYLNPGGSIKDRTALAMIDHAEKTGALRVGGTIVEATSGNTGYAVAMVAAARGYRAVIVCSDKVAQEKIHTLKAYGAEIVRAPSNVERSSPEHMLNVAQRIADERENAVFTNQSFSSVNPMAHYHTTGPEIWKQSEGKITCFVSSAGTGGTISGAGKYLKEKNRNIEVVMADPMGSIYGSYWQTREIAEPHPYLVEAAGQSEPFIPTAFDPNVVDSVIQVSDADSMRMAQKLAKEEGIFCGMSSGMIICAALEVAAGKKEGDLVVAIVCDTADKYLSRLHSSTWLAKHLPESFSG